jgi:7,8-dihydropterin-6-yl-methyl-4-(beta-D-ribofuranosyl)aminobenzene 5'-phosphate synthase
MFRQCAPLPGGDLLLIREIPSPQELAAKGAIPAVSKEPQVLLDAISFIRSDTSTDHELRERLPRPQAAERGR